MAARRLLVGMPDEPMLNTVLGLIEFGGGGIVAAEACFARAVGAAPAHAQFRVNWGLALARLDRHAAAREQFEAALRLAPDLPEAWFNLGALALIDKAWSRAADFARRVVAVQPSRAEAHYNLGMSLAGLRDWHGAMAAYAAALKLRPSYPDALNNLGLAQAALGDLLGAERSLHACLALQPKHAAALCNLGTVHARAGDDAQARSLLRQAVALDGKLAAGWRGLAEACLQLRLTDDAEAAYREALALDPDDGDALAGLGRLLQWQCRWAELETVRPRLVALSLARARAGRRSPLAPHYALSQGLSPAEERVIAESWARETEQEAAAIAPGLAFTHARTRAARLRIGYLSNDWHNQATAHLMVGLFEQHDRDRFEVFAYSYGPDDGSDHRRRIAAAARLVDLRALSHTEAARRIHADGTHILVDPKGYTLNARPLILALRPAPIQVNYLGFPGTISGTFHDYILADRVVIPAAEHEHYAERVVTLQECYQINDDRQPIADHPASRAACGLPEAGFVYCCFNEVYKIDAAIFALWMRVLARVPGSLLWLRDFDAATVDNLRAAAERHGVSGERLVPAPLVAKAQHLARLRLADLFLDTPLLNAHTTATDALYAGIPVLTCPGRTFATRVAASLLKNIGLDMLIAPDLAAYEAAAVEIATAPGRAAALKARLAANRISHPLFGTTRLVRHIEWAYERMWQRHADGEPPAAFSVPPLPR